MAGWSPHKRPQSLLRLSDWLSSDLTAYGGPVSFAAHGRPRQPP